MTTSSDARPDGLGRLDAQVTDASVDGPSPGPHDGWPPWLYPHRATIPGQVSGYLDRPALVARCFPTNRSITVLRAPGGFGKTTLLAQCCRTLTSQGTVTAWLTMDGRDEPWELETYLAYAFQRAGLSVLDSIRLREAGLLVPSDRLEVLAKTLKAHPGPCVLALDELEHISNPETVDLLNRLLNSRVPNLHLALSCRELPLGLDIVSPKVDEEIEILNEEDLRFSRQDIQRFFGGKLSRRKLATVATESAGWPIALRVQRNARQRPGKASASLIQNAMQNWIDSHLWSRLEQGDRELLLDAGLMDWMDAELVDEALAGVALMRRIEEMSAISGLIAPVRGQGGKVWRLHPLIREYCSARRRRETPERFRSLHCSIARALAGRGEPIAAMRHAAEAEDAELVGRILTEAGGIWLMLRESHHRMVSANRFLTDEVMAMYPRLRLVRAVAQVVKGQLADARRTLGVDARNVTVGGLNEGVHTEAEWCLVRSILAQNACESVGSESARHLISEYRRIAESPDVGPVMRAIMEYSLCQVHNQKAEFDAARLRAENARRWLGNLSSSFSLLLDLQLGQIAMAQGRVQDANTSYQRALRNATRDYLNDPRMVVLGQVLTRELDLERNRIPTDGKPVPIPNEFWQMGAQFASYAAASAIAVELKLAERGAQDALALVNRMLNHAHHSQLASQVRYLAGLRVAILVEAGQVGDADRSWRAEGLPQSPTGCLDLDRQSWREMEMLACARLRLLFALGDRDDARRLVRDLLEVASGRGLRRTAMRALALAVAFEEEGGSRAVALRHLTAFLRLFEETDYARALVREGATVAPVMKVFLDRQPESTLRNSAKDLLDAATTGQAETVPILSERETEILARLETQTDRQIGAAIGLTRAGVRYHLHSLFSKLNVRDRLAATHRARSLGLLSPIQPDRVDR